MAVKLSGQYTTGTSNVKGVRTRDSDGAFWNTSGTPAFEAYNAANIADYGITAAETGSTGVYTFTDPADTIAGRFRLVAAAGASLVVSDLANNVVWEDVAGLLGTGATLTSLASAANLATLTAYVDTEVAAILADTNELQTDWVNGGRLDLLIDAIKAKTDSLTFTVGGVVDANVQRINDVTITGDGQPGTEFGV